MCDYYHKISQLFLQAIQESKDEDPAPLLTALFDIGAPDVDPWASRNLTGCLRCAVVGNSGNLRQANYGEEIDGYDLIFRCACLYVY